MPYRASSSSKKVEEAVKHCAALEKQYTWLLQEKASFGSGDYDFSLYGGQKKALGDYHHLEARLEELKGRVNHQVWGWTVWKGCVEYVRRHG